MYKDLEDLIVEMKKARKWYWWLPIIGMIKSEKWTYDYMQNNGLMGNFPQNPKYQYETSETMGVYRTKSKGLSKFIKKFNTIHKYTLGISAIILFLFEFLIVNIGPTILMRMSQTIIDKEKAA